MRQVQSFAELDAAMRFRLDRLEKLARGGAALAAPEKRREAGYLAIELHNCWSGFTRSVFLSIMCGARTLSGGQAFPRRGGVSTSPDDAINRAIADGFGRRGEPHWFDQVIYTRMAVHFDFNNLGSITSAFAYPTSFFRLPTVRNFFAHKNEGTATKVDNFRSTIGLSTPTCPGQLLVDVISPTSPPLAIEWIHDAKVMSRLMLQ